MADKVHCRAHNHLMSELFNVVSIIMMLCYKKSLRAKKSNKQCHALTQLYLCHVTPESSFFNYVQP